MTKQKTESGGGGTLLPVNQRLKASTAIVGQGKGGVGKTLVATLFIDLLSVRGVEPRIVQVDEQRRLETLYPGRVTSINAVSMDDVRRDPGKIVEVFDAFYNAIEQTASDRIPLVTDVGSLQQHAVEDYCALIDADEEFVRNGIDGYWMIPTTAEPESMRGAVRTAEAVGRVLPSVKRTIVLNMRDGPFTFYPGSSADIVWSRELEPLCRKLGAIDLPAIAPGSWLPFEAAGLRFTDVVSAEISEIQMWTGRSRPVAKVLRGDVASFLAKADAALAPILDLMTGSTK